MEEPRLSLAKANRQFHEVRDELARLGTKVDEVQAKNAKYLEEISLLDSEVTRVCGRAALSEQRLAEMFEQKRLSEEVREEQEASESQALTACRAEVEATREAAERLNAENAVEAKAQEQRQASDAASRQRVATTIKDLECKNSAQKSVAETSRRRTEKLQDEIAAERRSQEELHRKMRQALESKESSLENLQTLKDTVLAKGGDPAMKVAGLESAPPEADAADLRSELATAEESCRRLRATLSEEADRCSQTVASLHSALDGARDELQRNLTKAAEAQRNEAARLESEVQAERQRADREDTESRAATQRAERLKASLLELRERPARAPLQDFPTRGRSLTTSGGHAKLVAEQLRKIQDEVAAVEVRCQERLDESHRLERQRLAVEAEGMREAQQVKSKIQELWHLLAVATAGK